MAAGLPRFKRDLPATPVQEGEYTFYEVKQAGGDPVRLYDFEYNLAMELDGRAFDNVAASANQKYGMELTGAQVDEFSRSLEQLGLLQPAVHETEDAAAPTNSGWRSEQSEPTALMDGMDGIAQLLDQVSMQPDPVRVASAPMVPEDGAVRQPGLGDRDATRPAPITPSSPATIAPPSAPGLSVPRPARPGIPIPGMGDDDDEEDAVLDVAAATSDTLPTKLETAPRNAGAIDPMAALDMPPLPAGPAPTGPMAAELSVPPQARGSSKALIWAVLGILVALAVAGLAIYKFVLPGGGGPVSVRTVQPAPVSVYRWFDVAGVIEQAPPRALAFEAAGLVIDVRPAGSRFAADDVLALLEGGKALQNQLMHHRERLAFYQQMFETMKSEGNAPEMRQAELKINEKAQVVSETRDAILAYAVLAPTDGEIAETLVSVGTRVKAGEPALRLGGGQLQAVFSFARDDAGRARRLPFCRVLVGEQPVDCHFAPTDDDDSRVVAELALETGLQLGHRVRLARSRLDAVFAVPASALMQSENGDRVYVASPGGRAEMRTISLAEQANGEAIITQGIDVGDDVIVDVTSDLVQGARVAIAERTVQ